MNYPFKIKEGSSKRDENRKLHCENGFARKWTNGTLEYFIHGKRTRKEGPAITVGNSPLMIDLYYNTYINSWWINDKRYKFFNHYSFLNLQKLMKFLFYLKKEKMIWAPDKLGGVMIKKELMNLFNI